MKILGIHLKSLLEFARLQGLSLPDPFADLLQDPGMEIRQLPMKHYLDFQKYLGSQIDDPALGYRMGMNLSLASLGLIYQISQQATSVKEAVFYLNEYLGQTFPLVKVLLQEDSAEFYRIELQYTLDFEEMGVMEQMLLVVFWRELHAMSGGKMDEVDVYSLHSGVRLAHHELSVQKGEFSGLRLPATILDKELDELAKLKLGSLIPAFMAQMETLEANSSLSVRVKRTMLNLADPFMPEADQVAAILNVSTRSLQRGLKTEKTSFRKLSNQLKLTSAKHLLLNSQLSVTDVASSLGYSESSAFLRFFRKFTDQTPLAFRKQMLN